MKQPFNPKTWSGEPTEADLKQVAAQYRQSPYIKANEPGHDIGIPISHPDLSTMLDFDPHIDPKTLSVRTKE